MNEVNHAWALHMFVFSIHILFTYITTKNVESCENVPVIIIPETCDRYIGFILLSALLHRSICHVIYLIHLLFLSRVVLNNKLRYL